MAINNAGKSAKTKLKTTDKLISKVESVSILIPHYAYTLLLWAIRKMKKILEKKKNRYCSAQT